MADYEHLNGLSQAKRIAAEPSGELPAIGFGYVAGRESDHLPIFRDCFDLLLADPDAFWRPLRERR